MLKGLAKFLKMALEWDRNVRIPEFPFLPNVYFWIDKRH